MKTSKMGDDDKLVTYIDTLLKLYYNIKVEN